jgi:hypothetical protein
MDLVITQVTAHLPNGNKVSSPSLKSVRGAVMWEVSVERTELDVPGRVSAWRSGSGSGRTRSAAKRAAVRDMLARPLSSSVRA